MEKPMGGPAEEPYAPPPDDPGALPFVPMLSESIMLGEHTAPAGSMREEHATTDLRSLTVQMSPAAQDPPTTTTAHAVYAEDEIQTMQGRTMGSADGQRRGHPGGNLWVKDPTTGIWTAGGASPSRIPNLMGSGPTGPHSMEERDVRGVYSHPPASGGEAGSDPCGHFGVTWGVYLCAGRLPLADIILFNPPDLTRCDSVIGRAIPAMSGHIQYRGTASGDLYIGISGINRVFLS